MSSIIDQTETVQPEANVATKARKKASVGARRASVASGKARAGKRATRAKKTPKSAPKAKVARDGSKTAKVLDLLKQTEGVTSKELMKATGWQPHSVRGFLSGTIVKKMGMTVTSAKNEDGERNYSIKA